MTKAVPMNIFVHKTNDGHMGLRKVAMSITEETQGECFLCTPNQTSNVATDIFYFYTDEYVKASMFARQKFFDEDDVDIIIRRAK